MILLFLASLDFYDKGMLNFIKAFSASIEMITIFLFFGKTWIWTQGFPFAKQALYHLSHTSNPFLLWLFWRWDLGELFALASFKPSSSWSQPPKELRLQSKSLAQADFVLDSIYVQYYIYWFAHVKPSFHSWNEIH
jgi:hypothetical protein